MVGAGQLAIYDPDGTELYRTAAGTAFGPVSLTLMAMDKRKNGRQVVC